MKRGNSDARIGMDGTLLQSAAIGLTTAIFPGFRWGCGCFIVFDASEAEAFRPSLPKRTLVQRLIQGFGSAASLCCRSIEFKLEDVLHSAEHSELRLSYHHDIFPLYSTVCKSTLIFLVHK